MSPRPVFLVALVSFSGLANSRAYAAPSDYFGVRVVDEGTGRGVPLVELKTTSQERFVTDSNGWAAIGEPDLMGQSTYFSVSSPGYELAADGFGYRGQAFDVRGGGRGQIKIKRINVAERLYRLTGAGIYRDSALLGEPVPIEKPLLNGGVTGQDTVMMTPYVGKLFWFWGDTNRTGYPLGNFATSGATSLLPAQGGLDPSVGVNYTYWTDKTGFAKAMIPLPNRSGPVWVGGLITLKENGREELFTHYVKLGGDGKAIERGLAQFNDESAIFEKKLTFSGPLYPDNQPTRVTENGADYFYFNSGSSEAMPLVRIRADKAHLMDPLTYESFTPLRAGAQAVGDKPDFERDGAGNLRYGWKVNTVSPGFDARKKASESGQIKAEELPFALRDVETGAPIQSHGGSVCWNPFRGRWVMITTQASGGPSYLGELYFAEADTPVGPWVYARKILTHPKYTFYNPTQHPYFDQQGGRLIYFEGTYTSTYSGNETPTPRYDYNQMMYRLDLDDARLTLPAPVYEIQSVPGAATLDYTMREGLKAGQRPLQTQNAPFFAIPAAREHARLTPIYRAAPTKNAGARLTAAPPTGNATGATPLFYALPTTPAPGEKVAPSLVPLYEFRGANGQARYATDAAPRAGETRGEAALCRVWRNPVSTLSLDFEALPGR